MNVNREEVPLIDLAPKLKHPLSLWNPLGYLRFLFWTFFFPQAIRWYVDTFVNPENSNMYDYKNFKEFIKLTFTDSVLLKLIIQTIVISLISVSVICFIFERFNIPINWYGFAGFFVFIWISILWREKEDDSNIKLPYILVSSVLLNIAGSIMFGMGLSIVFGFKGVVTLIVSIFILLFAATLVAGIIGISTIEVIQSGISFGAVKYKAYILGFFIFIGGVALIFARSSGGVRLSLMAILAIVIINIRPLEYVMTTLYLLFFSDKEKLKHLPYMCRMVFLPLPGIQRQLEDHLDMDWEKGVYNANQILSYSMQYISVIKAIKTKLENSPEDMMLARISALTMKPYDWQLIPAISEKPLHIYWNEEAIPNLDTTVHAACAGFWYWHEKEPGKAMETFALVRNLRYGIELYNTARVIDRGLSVDDIQALSSWEQETEWLDTFPGPELRPGTLNALRMLHTITSEATVLINTPSVIIRSTSFYRATAILKCLIETGGTFCPEPEWPLVQDMIQKWQDILTGVGGIIAEKLLYQPTINPYEGHSGLPVTGTTFTGRADILRQIETHWAIGGFMPTLILYGHHRMGKTSILRSLSQNTDAHNIYVYMIMQRCIKGDNTVQLFRDMVEAVYKVMLKFFPDIGPFPEHADFLGLDDSRRNLESLLDLITPLMTGAQRLILAIDEFEFNEFGINEGRVNPGLFTYLRFLNQQYSWLGLIFAGRNTPEEIGRDYHFDFQSLPIYIQVSYLSRIEALKLITQPHPDFSLEYDDNLIDEIYRLTYGQPYLVQLLCWGLVNRWNDRSLEKGVTTPRLLIPGDLEPVLTPEFYQAAGYYFEGVWGNATKNEQALLRLLSRFPHPLPQPELEAAAINAGFPPDPKIMKESLKLLSQHDIITESETGIGYASELMRRWVEQQS